MFVTTNHSNEIQNMCSFDAFPRKVQYFDNNQLSLNYGTMLVELFSTLKLCLLICLLANLNNKVISLRTYCVNYSVATFFTRIHASTNGCWSIILVQSVELFVEVWSCQTQPSPCWKSRGSASIHSMELWLPLAIERLALIEWSNFGRHWRWKIKINFSFS